MDRTKIADANHYTLSSSELCNLLSSTVAMFLEYRDAHGFDEDTAGDAAVVEMLEGIDAMIDMQATPIGEY